MYKVMDEHDNIVGSWALIQVGPAGELYVKSEYGTVVSIFAPGTWTHIFWESNDAQV